ncbi:c-type cytochrome [Leptolyngbya sp. AN02str]|uniref:c-type cytochrome n=1 Tax=Leptolyngbya sp. AN02str TaxID=3423363 RepID=UPI003D319509
MTEDLLETNTLGSQTTSQDMVVAPDVVPWRRLIAVASGVLMAIVGAIAALYIVQHSDPYVQSVLSVNGDAMHGQEIFQMNCATCHGLTGGGVVGPSLHHVSTRKSRVGLIHQVTSGQTPPMPQFQPNPEEMADLLKYLETL